MRTIESLPLVGARGRNPLSSCSRSPASSPAPTPAAACTSTARATAPGTSRSTGSTRTSRARAARTSRRCARTRRAGRVQGADRQHDRGVRPQQRRAGGDDHAIGHEQLSGTLFYFDRRPEYNANEWENNIDGLPKRKFDQRMPGFSVGGPHPPQPDVLLRQLAVAECGPDAHAHAHGVHGRSAPGSLPLQHRRPQPPGRRGGRVGRRQRQPARAHRDVQRRRERPAAARPRSDHPAHAGEHAAAEQLHHRRRPEHGRLHLDAARRRKSSSTSRRRSTTRSTAGTARSCGSRRGTRTRCATRSTPASRSSPASRAW
jgi:hypothetical protein